MPDKSPFLQEEVLNLIERRYKLDAKCAHCKQGFDVDGEGRVADNTRVFNVQAPIVECGGKIILTKSNLLMIKPPFMNFLLHDRCIRHAEEIIDRMYDEALSTAIEQKEKGDKKTNEQLDF